MDELIYEVLVKFQEKRTASGKGPVDVLPWLEIQKEIKMSLTRLSSGENKKLHRGNTINDTYFRILKDA